MLDSPAPGSEGDSDKRSFKDSKKARDDSHAYINIYPYREGMVRITLTNPYLFGLDSDLDPDHEPGPGENGFA